MNMKNLVCLAIMACASPSFAQPASIEVIPWTCSGVPDLGSMSVAPYSEKVAFSATIPEGTTWSLHSCADGVCQFERVLSASTVFDTVVVEHEPTFVGMIDSYNLTLQLFSSTDTIVSDILFLNGFPTPAIDTSCAPQTGIAMALTNSEKEQFTIWPNPSAGAFNMRGADGFDYAVIDMAGKVVDQGTSMSGQAEVGGDLNPGLYLITMNSAGSPTKTVRVVRE